MSFRTPEKVIDHGRFAATTASEQQEKVDYAHLQGTTQGSLPGGLNTRKFGVSWWSTILSGGDGGRALPGLVKLTPRSQVLEPLQQRRWWGNLGNSLVLI